LKSIRSGRKKRHAPGGRDQLDLLGQSGLTFEGYWTNLLHFIRRGGSTEGWRRALFFVIIFVVFVLPIVVGVVRLAIGSQ
jgi:hypothetical protein